MQPALLKLLLKLRRSVLLEGFHESLSFFDHPVDFRTVVEVIGERGVDIGERQVVFSGDLVRTLAQPLVPDYDVLHSNAMPGDSRLSAYDSGGHIDMTVQ